MSRRHRSAGILLIAAALAIGGLWWLDRPQGSAAESVHPDEPVLTRRAASVRAEAPEAVTARLLSDVEIIQPGTSFRLGVMLHPRPGWHVVAPTGHAAPSPTAVRFRLPDGFAAEPVLAPKARSFERPDGTTTSGYTDEVLMYARVRASNLDPDRDWHLAADVSWTACERTCESGETTVDLWLPASISGTRLQHFRNIRLFDEWASRMAGP